MARRNKLLGLWIAEYLDIVGDEAEAYAREVVKSDFIGRVMKMSLRKSGEIFKPKTSTSPSIRFAGK